MAEHPSDAGVRKWLAKALYSSLFFEREENEIGRFEALFRELEALSDLFPDDAGIREPFAMALAYALSYAAKEKQLQLRDELFERLRQLAHRYPEDGAVREWLASSETLMRSEQS